ncbi:MAG: cysteine--tRNA ligase [Planctomycetes bacterium]|nr:cysteine--tRNA ligase [Planctomycetota bacterium]
MSLRVYNTLTHTKEVFEPLDPPKVGIYLCGPTVYKPSHIGHAVGPIVFDAIKRYLTFRGYEVTWVVNVTDVEDKIIVEAARQGCSSLELARRVTQDYLEAMTALNVTGIDRMPKASEHIGDIIAFVEKLIERGYAYVVGGDVYFDVTADEDYGKLSNRSIDDQVGQRELVSGPKRHPGDFALWKEAKPEEPDEVKFDSPWGPGRPGWHIECSVMSQQMLGESFDIHGGGMDLIFPHHENEVAQSESATGRPFAKYWLHHGLTRFNTKKVSKSDPQMQQALQEMTLSNLLRKYSGELLRFFVLSTHYRRPIEYSPAELNDKRKGLETFYRLFERIERISGESVYNTPPEPRDSSRGRSQEDIDPQFATEIDGFRSRFLEAMDDDFNTAAAIAALFEQAKAINRFIENHQAEEAAGAAARPAALWAGRRLVAIARLLGLFLEPQPQETASGADRADEVMALLIEVRSLAKTNKDFATADLIRDRLDQTGVTLEDRAGETSYRVDQPADDLFDRATTLLVEVRDARKREKDFATADLIRDKLGEAGVTIEDRPDGASWRRG